MNSIDPKVMSKIKKCLALASSDNPHEAAAAMRQANALMEKHGVSTSLITASEIGESETKSVTMSRKKPAHWEAALASMIGRAFGCQMLLQRYTAKWGRPLNEGIYIYVGMKAQAEIASYTASVLIRKCKKARAEFIKVELGGLATSGIKGAKGKATRMGDAFAEGYVQRLHKLVMDFANPEGIDEAIEAHVNERYSNANDASTRKIKNVGEQENAAAYYGMKAAEGESLHRPMNKNSDALMIGM
jgi:Protein of unknown function (DUF2786)